MTRPERGPSARRPLTATPEGPATAAYLAPAVPEVAALLGAAERVLVACGRAEDAHIDRTVRIAAAVDPCTLPLPAVVGPGLPVPLAGRIAFRALQRLAVSLRPVLDLGACSGTAGSGTASPGTADSGTGPGGDGPVAFHALRVDTTDLAILGQAAAQLTHPRRSHEGALGAAVGMLAARGGEPPDDRHPAALGCLLAVLVPVVDPVAAALHAAVVAPPEDLVTSRVPGPLTGDAVAGPARREVARRVLARLARAR